MARSLGVELPATGTAADALMALFERFVEPQLIEPTFVLDYPSELCPLTKRHRADPWIAERFELYAGGLELANAFSELTDPEEQLRRFAAESELRSRAGRATYPIPALKTWLAWPRRSIARFASCCSGTMRSYRWIQDLSCSANWAQKINRCT